MTDYEKIDKLITTIFGQEDQNGQYSVDRGNLHYFAGHVDRVFDEKYLSYERIASCVEGLYQDGKITWEEYKGIVK